MIGKIICKYEIYKRVSCISCISGQSVDSTLHLECRPPSLVFVFLVTFLRMPQNLLLYSSRAFPLRTKARKINRPVISTHEAIVSMTNPYFRATILLDLFVHGLMLYKLVLTPNLLQLYLA